MQVEVLHESDQFDLDENPYNETVPDGASASPNKVILIDYTGQRIVTARLHLL